MFFLEKVYSFTEKILFRNCPRVYRTLYSCYKAVSDKGERSLCRSVIKPGAVVIDVGANIGMYSEFFLKLIGPNGELHAFEPEPTNYGFMSQALNSYSNIFLHNKAVADCTDNITLYISDELNVDHRSFDSGEGRKTLIVPSVSLDDFFGGEKQIDFIKIDIQGFECQALLGMEKLLHMNRHVKLLLEYIPSGLEAAGYSGNELLNILLQNDFSLYTVSWNGSLVPLHGKEPSLNSMGYTNIFASRDKAFA